MISIKNIYYMLSYAYQNLTASGVYEVSSEEFDYASDLFASILVKGISRQLKQGLNKEYVALQEELASPKGKILLSETINNLANQSRYVECYVDEYIENTFFNRILKSVCMLLMASAEVKNENKIKLKRLLMHFSSIATLDLTSVDWDHLQFTRLNASYKPLMNICRLLVEGMVINEKDGTLKVSKYIDDEKMHLLFERFVAEYYRRHFPKLAKAQSTIDWNTKDSDTRLLPTMRSDIKLEKQGKALIIDTKYYSHSLQKSMFGRESIHSANMYQVYAYVKNYDKKHTGDVSGMLLYAKTDEEDPTSDFNLDGNKISVRTLDLNCDFDNIKNQMNQLVYSWMDENGLSNT